MFRLTKQLTGNSRLVETAGGGVKLTGWDRLGFGANLREAAHWPNPSNIANVLLSNKAQGIGHVRMYVHHVDVDWPTTLDRVLHWIEFTKAINMGIVLVFDDSIGLSGHYFNGFEEYHNASTLKHLNISWYRDGAYRNAEYTNRLQNLAALASQYDHVMIDLCNEPSIVLAGFDSTNYNAFLGAWQYLSEVAWEAGNGRVPITVGTISVNFPMEGFNPAKHFYENTPYLTLANVHLYREENKPHSPFQHEDMASVDPRYAHAAGKAVALGEFGVDQRNDNRAGSTFDFLQRFAVAHKIAMWTYWNTDSHNVFDQGFLDDLGIARYRGEYPGMIDLWRQYQWYFDNL